MSEDPWFTNVRKRIQERAESGKPSVADEMAEMIGSLRLATEKPLTQLLELDPNGSSVVENVKERARIRKEADVSIRVTRGAANKLLEIGHQQVEKFLYDPGEAVETARADDLAHAELLSRTAHPEDLEADARAYLRAGNARGAKVRLDALRLKGEPQRGADVIRFNELHNAVEAALDEQLPHRAAAKALNASINLAAERYREAESVIRANLESAAGRRDRAAAISANAKMQAYVAAQARGDAYVDPVGLPELVTPGTRSGDSRSLTTAQAAQAHAEIATEEAARARLSTPVYAGGEAQS